MFGKQISLTSATLLVLWATFGQSVLAQNRIKASSTTKAHPLESNAKVQGKAANLGPAVEVSSEVQAKPVPQQPANQSTGPNYKSRSVPQPAIPSLFRTPYSRGVNIIHIDTP
jgi:hypothetical protein